MTEFADNDGVSSFIKVISFYVNKGFYSRMSFSKDFTAYAITRKRLDAAKVENIADNMQKVLKYIRDNMNRAQRAMITQVNQHRLNVKFKKEDLIFLNSKNIISTRPFKKLDNKKYDSFKIKALIGSSYRLELLKIMRIHDVFSPKLLSLAVTDLLSDQKNSPPKSTMVDGLEEWVVDDILAFKKPWNRLKYQVNWEGFDKDLTWYNADRGEFDNAKDVVEEFHKKYLKALR